MCLGMKQFNRLNEVTYDDNAQTGLFAVANKSTCPEILFQIVYKQGDKDYHLRLRQIISQLVLHVIRNILQKVRELM